MDNLSLSSLPWDSPWIVFILLTILSASIIRGFSGFGFSAFVMICLGSVFPPVEVLPLNYLLELSVGSYLLLKSYKDANLKHILFLLPGIIIFNPIGMYLLKNLPLTSARIILSIVIIFLCLFLWKGKDLFKGTQSYLILLPMGGVSGFLNGFLSMGGIAAVVALLWVTGESKKIRATIVCLLFIMDIYSIAVAQRHGILYTNLPTLVIFAFPFMLFGAFYGTKLFKKYHIEYYREVVIILLIGIALIALFRASLQYFMA